MYPTLRDFIQALDDAGELHRVNAPVSPILEVAQIADRVSKSPAAKTSDNAKAFDPRFAHLGGKALLFENIEGAQYPLAINTFGSYARMEMALGCTQGGFEALAEEVEKRVASVYDRQVQEELAALAELFLVHDAQ